MPAINRKRVRFALEKDYAVHTIPHRLDYDASQRSEIWVSLEEYETIREEVKRIVSLMDRRTRYGRQKLAPVQECTRGLECQTQQGAIAKKVASLDGICAVLMEQDHQQSIGNFNGECIRRRYMEMTSGHVEAALRRAEQDADYDSPEDENSRNLPEKQHSMKRGRNAPIVNFRPNRSRLSRLLFGGTPQRTNSWEKRRAEEAAAL